MGIVKRAILIEGKVDKLLSTLSAKSVAELKNSGVLRGSHVMRYGRIVGKDPRVPHSIFAAHPRPDLVAAAKQRAALYEETAAQKAHKKQMVGAVPADLVRRRKFMQNRARSISPAAKAIKFRGDNALGADSIRTVNLNQPLGALNAVVQHEGRHYLDPSMTGLRKTGRRMDSLEQMRSEAFANAGLYNPKLAPHAPHNMAISHSLRSHQRGFMRDHRDKVDAATRLNKFESRGGATPEGLKNKSWEAFESGLINPGNLREENE